MIFDQYSRYKACSELLRQAGFIAGNTVLDVGSGPECLFGQFMPDATMTFVDPLILDGSGKRRIAGDVFTSELNGQSFDCVSAVDVLEHISPGYRHLFLERLSSLCKNTLILGFPTSDSPDALHTDKAIEDQYREVWGHDYSWLEEHYRFGLPSLADTVNQLRQLGWHCQSVGHCHAPWLQDLLGFIICAWDIPSLKNVVLEISEKFNRELYPHDFRPPYYRYFIIASRIPRPPISVPTTNNSVEADKAFHELMEYAYRQFIVASMRQLADPQGIITERDTALRERDTALTERDTALRERDTALTERDTALRERDTALTENYAIRNTKAWKFVHLCHVIRWIIRHGGPSDYDRARVREMLYGIYQKMPVSVRRVLRYCFTKLVSDASSAKEIQRRILANTPFQPPSLQPASQASDLPDYIFWGVIDWHFRLQRPQHLARELSKRNRRIFYISEKLVDDERPGFEAESLDAENRLFQIRLYAKGAPTIYSSTPEIDLVSQLRTSIGEMLHWSNSDRLISIIQHPFWHDIAMVLPNSTVVYDCMDHHEGFGNNSPEILRLEQSLLRNSDLTITTSEYLKQAIDGQTKRQALIRNAGEFEYFSQQPSSFYRDPQGRKVIGYYGAIAEWFDQSLLESVARRFHDYKILLIGADTTAAKSRLGRLPNVEFVGEVAYSALTYYLYGFDVCLLPFKVIPLTLATNPVKVYEYLSAGKRVVSVDLPEMRHLGDLIYVAGSTDSFLAAIDDALSHPEDQGEVAKRRTFAREQTWAHRVESLISVAESATNDSKVSVIVVTYNNLYLTKACLESLERYSGYSPLEIVVVDNFSSDGTREFLAEWSTASANRKAILNDSNRGFAAANNQGLIAASGEYLVLLNNDTYVTPGWIRTLLNHLRRDNSIGLIGPVTNNIGNEAKIDIAYNNMEEMLKASARYTRKRIGQTMQLRTLAFFCVMMKREVYERVGPLDEAFGKGFFEDDDYCRRIEQLGLGIVCVEDVFIHHHLSASFNKMKNHEREELFEQNKAVYEAKWGPWVPHTARTDVNPVPVVFRGCRHIPGKCNVCGNDVRFFYNDALLFRESLWCEYCLATSRYRSIARGILRAINDLSGISIHSLAVIPRESGNKELHIYDTQSPFYYESCAYPLPDFLKASGWIDVRLSLYKPDHLFGTELADGITNQNLECLTFPDASLDIVITSDVMEHVRLDDRAHQEIHRVLRKGGIYIFTVPHNREMQETIIRVKISDPDDPSKDIHLLEPEYHGDTTYDGVRNILSYRTYGRDIEDRLTRMGFHVEYSREDFPERGIINTELYYCRKVS